MQSKTYRTLPSLPLHPLNHPNVRILSKCLNTAIFASIYRPTQFCMHGSSLRSSVLPPFSSARPSLVMHFLKHVDVNVWTSVCPRVSEIVCEGGREGVLIWMLAFCSSLCRNCCSSLLSEELSVEASMPSRLEEGSSDILGFARKRED